MHQPDTPPDTDFDSRDTLVVLSSRDLRGLESYLRDRYYALLSGDNGESDEIAHRIRRLGIDTDSIQVHLSNYNANHAPERKPFDRRRTMAAIMARQTNSDGRWAQQRLVRIGGLPLDTTETYDSVYANTKENLVSTPLNALEMLRQQSQLRTGLEKQLEFSDTAEMPRRKNGLSTRELAQSWRIHCQSPRRHGKAAYVQIDRTLDDLEKTVGFGCSCYPHSSYRIVPGRKEWTARAQRLRPALSGEAARLLGLQDEMWLRQVSPRLHRRARARLVGHILSVSINTTDDLDTEGLEELEEVLLSYYRQGLHVAIGHSLKHESNDSLEGKIYVYSKSPDSILPGHWHLGM